MKAEGGKQKGEGSEGTRTRFQRLGFALMAVLTCLMGLSFAEKGIADKPEQNLTFTVRVYNYVQASPAILAGAEREAGRILSDAGVQTVWMDCLDVDAATDRQKFCRERLGPDEFVLRLLDKPSTNWFRDTVFGFANIPALASVYYHQAVILAQTDDAEFESPIVLGCAMAHEIGHLLLGSNSHSDTGIMRGQWGRKDVQQALMGRRLFTPEQAKVIREEVRRRAVLQAGARL